MKMEKGLKDRMLRNALIFKIRQRMKRLFMVSCEVELEFTLNFML